MSVRERGTQLLLEVVGPPTSRPGRWSVGLELAFLVLFVAWLLWVQAVQMPRPTFFSDPVHAVLILSAAAAAIAGCFSGLVGLFARGERSFLVVLCVLVGAVVLYWTVAEAIGH